MQTLPAIDPPVLRRQINEEYWTEATKKAIEKDLKPGETMFVTSTESRGIHHGINTMYLYFLCGKSIDDALPLSEEHLKCLQVIDPNTRMVHDGDDVYITDKNGTLKRSFTRSQFSVHSRRLYEEFLTRLTYGPENVD